MPSEQQTVTAPSPTVDRHGMSDILNKYIDSLIADGKRHVIDERNTAVTNLTNDWNRSTSELISKRNSEMDSLRKHLPQSGTSFTTGAGLTAGGYGLGRLAALSKRIGKTRGNKAGLVGAGLTAGGIMLKDKLFPRQTQLPSNIPTQWVDPSAQQTPTTSPTTWQKFKNMILPQKGDTERRKWVTDKKYPSLVAGGTKKTSSVPDPDFGLARLPRLCRKERGSVCGTLPPLEKLRRKGLA